jgi:formylglycine-generating enzyme required for sulfatase activity
MRVAKALDRPLSIAEREPADFPPPWASAWGDDRFGLWAELQVKDEVQRLRWIEPGEFLMGSPDDEQGRFDDEGPQHAVRLTEGFWLADTACSQALWLAVMGGNNPSEFKDDPQNPVEQVSWDDVQGFLQALQSAWTEGCTAALPTEAEWEYACRAGTPWPFSFGQTITTAQVNFDGNYPYGDGPRGDYRERTVPVKALPPNGWGLYQMHGNVWEWCADGAGRRYSALKPGGVLGNPIQPPEQGMESLRVIRGGSWVHGARNVRSADRGANHRGRRGISLGFRLALRSSSPSQDPEDRAPQAPPGS